MPRATRTPKPKLLTVRVDEIVIDPRAQARADGLDESHVAQMEEEIDDLPPPHAVRFDGRIHLDDGFHRLEAYKRKKRFRIQVMVVDGTEDDWIDAFAGANHDQKGKPRSPADKRTAVQRVIEFRGEQWSNRRIAEAARVDEKLVRKVRAALGQVRPAAPENTDADQDADASQLRPAAVDEPVKREGKDGKMRPATKPNPKKDKTVAASEPADDPAPTAAVPPPPPPPPAEPVSQQPDQVDDDTEQAPTPAPTRRPKSHAGEPELDPRFMPNAAEALRMAPLFLNWKQRLESVRAEMRKALPDRNHPLAVRIDLHGQTGSDLTALIDTIGNNVPEFPCPCCCGTGTVDAAKCRHCSGYGVVDRSHYDGLKARWKHTAARLDDLTRQADTAEVA